MADDPTTHDVALTFAGPQREYAKRMARALRAWGVRVFFDEDFEIEMWGENLAEYLQNVYEQDARYVVMLISADYVERPFPTVERRSAFFGQMSNKTRVLPIRFDDTEVPGLDKAVAYQDARKTDPRTMADRIAMRLQRDGVPLRRPTPGSVTLSPRLPTVDELTIDVALSDGSPVSDAEVCVVMAGGQLIRAANEDPDHLGTYGCSVPSGQLLRLWVAHSEHPPIIRNDIETSTNAQVELGTAAGVASKVFFGSTGYLPPLRGRFNPILDSLGRRYLYVDNASIAGQTTQPVTFECGTPFEIEDADGSITVVNIHDLTSHGSVIEYEAPQGA